MSCIPKHNWKPKELPPVLFVPFFCFACRNTSCANRCPFDGAPPPTPINWLLDPPLHKYFHLQSTMNNRCPGHTKRGQRSLHFAQKDAAQHRDASIHAWCDKGYSCTNLNHYVSFHKQVQRWNSKVGAELPQFPSQQNPHEVELVVQVHPAPPNRDVGVVVSKASNA